MKFSIIIPSYNQDKFIGATLDNLKKLKESIRNKEIKIEILLFDSQSNQAVLNEINQYKDTIDFVEIKKDNGQYDAINKGIEKCTGDYWTWLNTDDLLSIDSFLKVVDILNNNPTIDYIYGGIDYINENGHVTLNVPAYDLNLKILTSKNPSIFQPGSFFKKSFTDKIGLLNAYRCCFDYEYILRCLKNNAVFHTCNFSVAQFRYYQDSKTGSIITIFIKEQLIISKLYGRKSFSYITVYLYLRLIKNKLFPR
jgi:glycosyltransferase involved in cell wall biosynthesis